MRDVPILPPERFARAYERWLAAIAGAVELDAGLLKTAYDLLESLHPGRDHSIQQRLAAVAFKVFKTQSEFTAFLARAEALSDLLTDPAISARWVSRNWAQMNRSGDGIAPARNLLFAAAKCPLKEGAGRFNTEEFETRVKALFES